MSEPEASRERKAAPSAAAATSTAEVKCPRCDSPNTKFCYYNNYSLTQPRHFCKTCRRYWTKGGALRNVPVGGGCRKNKKNRSSGSSSSSSSSLTVAQFGIPTFDGPIANLSVNPTAGLKFFGGGISPIPAMDFQSNHFAAGAAGFRDFPPLGFASTATATAFNCAGGLPGAAGMSNGLASSIESLSSINQDLHWKLQRQRMGIFFAASEQQGQQQMQQQHQQQQHHESVSFHVRGDHSEVAPWFLENSYSSPGNTNTNANANANAANNNTGNWSGIQAWNDLQPFSALP